MDTLAVFRSRSEAVRLYGVLKKQGMACMTVNTPSSLKMGCGLSVLFDSSLTQKVIKAVNVLGLKTYAGMYKR